MKSFVVTCFLLCYAAGVQAQGVYVSPGDQGPLFSDKPQPGAKEIILRPLTVVAPTPAAKAAPSPPVVTGERGRPPAAAPSYRSFFVVSPENDGSVLANTAIFEVRVAVDPPLQLGEGHAIAVSINGRPVAQRFTATEFMIPPEFWGDTLPPPNQSVQLDASIVDGNGQVLRKAAPVRFFMRHATILNRPRRPPAPPLIAPPGPPPKARPEIEPPAGATGHRLSR